VTVLKREGTFARAYKQTSTGSVSFSREGGREGKGLSKRERELERKRGRESDRKK